jgi:hypothetical protein
MDSVNENQKAAIDESITKFFVQCRIPFLVVESNIFLEMLQRLRPAYTQEKLIPSRRQLSGRLLEDVFKKTKARVLELIRAWTSSSDQITVCVDRWENVNYCHIVNVLASCNGRQFSLILFLLVLSLKQQTRGRHFV